MERKSSRTGSCTGGLSEKFLLADAQGADSPYVMLYRRLLDQLLR